MRIQRVYVDTSVVGGCHDAEFTRWSTALMTDFERGTLQPVVSDVLDAEIQDAPAFVRRTYSRLLRFDPDYVELSSESEALARRYLARDILSANYFDDALHIALATVAAVDVLVSWNFRHIVHFDKIRRFNAVNLELGYKPVDIYSPREVATHEDEEG